jgi:oxygen-independent coproporphyrinogen-3 oxidase
MSTPIGIYVHIPFCRVVCPYCDFVKKRTNGSVPDEFVDALCTEIEAFDGPSEAQSIFLGGGTPSLMTPKSMERLFDLLHKKFSFVDEPEFGIEVNPDDVTPDLIDTWKRIGINRVSLGVQSFNDEVLKFLGRCHNSYTARMAAHEIAEHFPNWGMDLIFGGKPSDVWESTLEEAIQFEAPHMSTYGLTYETNTPFWNQRHTAIDDDDSLGQYRLAMDTFTGYVHYEVSNFAKEGFESSHNRIYWRNGEYAAFGPGAVSYLGNRRAKNTSVIHQYIEAPQVKEEVFDLSEEETKLETCIQYFRTRSGLPKTEYAARFGCSMDEDFGPALAKLKKRGLLDETESAWHPTRLGYELNNEIGLTLLP